MRILVYGMNGTVNGGIESFLINMNKYMSKDCIFDYVIDTKECIHSKSMAEKGSRIYYLTSYYKNIFVFLYESFKIPYECKKDHKIAYFNLFSMCHIFGVIICKLMGYKIVLHAHNSNVSNKNKLYIWLHFFDRWLFRNMKCVRLTNSKASSDFMFGKDSILIYNGIKVSKYKFSENIREKKRKELGVENKFVVGFAGRLAVEKNLLFLVEVFNEIYKIDKNSILLIVGEGNEKSKIENKVKKLEIKENVMLLGHQRDLAKIYQAMDVFVLPSLFEGLGIVLVEAQASGLKCFTSDRVVPSIVKIANETLEFVSLNKSPKFWANRILNEKNVIRNREKWNTQVLNSGFNIENEALRLEKILNSCL